MALSVVLFSSCGSFSKLVTTATDLEYKGMKPITVTDVIADLEVSSDKISFFYMPSKAVNNAGAANVTQTAIREALLANGNADVLVGLETQTKYNAEGDVESITVSGYPAKYVNFRSVNEKYILDMTKLYIDLNLKINSNPAAAAAEVTVPDLIPERVVYSIKDAGVEKEKGALPIALPSFGKRKK